MAVRAAWHVDDVAKKFADSTAKTTVKQNDLYAADLLTMTRAHHLYLSLRIYRRKVEEKQFTDPNIKPLLNLLGRVFALKQLTLDSAALYECGYFAPGSRELLVESMKIAVKEVRPQIVPLTELVTVEEQDLTYLSAIGNKYGDIYERQLELAMGSRLNREPKPQYWDSLVKPIIEKAKL